MCFKHDSQAFISSSNPLKWQHKYKSLTDHPELVFKHQGCNQLLGIITRPAAWLQTAMLCWHKNWCMTHSGPPVLKLGRLCNALKNFSSVIPEAWIINRGWSLNTSNTRILLVFNHPVDCLVQAVYFCSGQNSKLWTMGQECQSSKEIIMI